MARRGSREWRKRVAKGTARGLKPWHDGLRVLPADVRGFVVRGQIARSLRPMVVAAIQTIGQYAEDLGGEENLTAGQRVGLQNLFRSIVAANGLFSRYLRTGKRAGLKGVAPYANSELRTLQLLGLGRSPRKVPSLPDYLDTVGRGAPGGSVTGLRSGSRW